MSEKFAVRTAAEPEGGSSSDGPLPAELDPIVSSLALSDSVLADEAPDAPASASAPQRVRARLARLTGNRPTGTPPVLEPLFRSLRQTHPKSDLDVIERAYRTAEHFHRGQKRKSGDPYITHPIAVATILAEIGMPGPVIAAALLHDTVEDTPYSLDALQADFGAEVARLVDGVTKLDKVRYGSAAKAETVRKMVVAMAADVRVLVIKLADRLHNMRTLRFVSPASQERTARETLEIYAPLAHRLGMNTLKWELEDLAFATLYPKMYEEIVRLVGQRAPRRDQYLSKVLDSVNGDLRESRIKCTVSGRPKHYYSVYQKMIVRGRDFADIYDLVGVRVLVDNVRDCYAALGAVHARWNPVPGRFKDYIAMPKFNMYQSLHTTVIGPDGKPVEVQIRTWSMHRLAEYGIAAHWKYKLDASPEAVGAPPLPAEDALPWIQQILDWQKETIDPSEFLDSLRYDLNVGQVYVFTPKGEVLALPTGSTPVDFAYAVHTEVGHRCVGARVNGKLVPLDITLVTGDSVEIFTNKGADAAPSRDWLGFVKSPRARTKIRQHFTRSRREDAVERGKDAIAKAMRKQGLPLQRLLTNETLTVVATDLRLTDISGLYAAVGESRVSANSVVSRVLVLLGGVESNEDDVAETIAPSKVSRSAAHGKGDAGVEVTGAGDVLVKLAKCCTPVPPDPIIGFVTRGNGVSVHRADCANVGSLETAEAGRLVDVHWAPKATSVFLVSIQVEALDRARLLSDISRVLSDNHVNILSAAVSTTRDRVAINKFTFEMGDTKHLGSVLKVVKSIDGVFDAYRVHGASSS